MSTSKVHNNDMKLEIVVIPVADVDRAKEFYGRLGWRLDAEFASGDDLRVIQFTPPGSGCSIIFGKNVTAAAPGSAQGLYLIVSDIAAARDELRSRGVEVSELFHSDGAYAGTNEPYLFGRRRTGGPDPGRVSYRSFASFRDPDGNGWLFQEITTRLAGRIDSGVTSFASANDLAEAFRRAESALGKYEARIGQGRDANWPEWVRRIHGRRAGGHGTTVVTTYDAIVIGTGQAGPYVTSRLAGAGMKVAVIERNAFGGTYVNTGCTQRCLALRERTTLARSIRVQGTCHQTFTRPGAVREVTFPA